MRFPYSCWSRSLFLALPAAMTTTTTTTTAFVASSATMPRLFLVNAAPGGSSSVSAGASRSLTSTTSLMASKEDDKEVFPTWKFDTPCDTMEWSELANVTVTAELGIASLEDADLIILGVSLPASKDEDEDENDDDNDEDTEEEEDSSPKIELEGLVQDIDDRLDGALSDIVQEQKSKMKKIGSCTPTLRTVGKDNKKRYIVMAMSKQEDNDATTGFEIGKALADKLQSETKITTAHVLLPDTIAHNNTLVRDLTTALYGTMDKDKRYAKKNKKKDKDENDGVKTIELFAQGATMEDVEVDQDSIKQGKHIAWGVLMSKDIVNAPHNVLNSESLAATAKRLAAETPHLTCRILDKAECEKRGMGSYLGVARGSETDPQFIHLTYTPPNKKGQDVATKVGVVGKGLLFDTGGYNIKTKMMELMKFDCGGAAAVLGAARAVALLAPEDVEAHFVVAACENMINQRAVVPSDILTASNGKTIEVMNTDAEGRLTLADALVYVDKELGCSKIIELSTLTGACMVALGKGICGLWTHDDELAQELEDISKVTGDKSWRMPMAKEYNEQLESKFADLKNIGGPYGGSITAALFLQNFVNSKKPFAHIDIAGPVWNDKTGATGFGAKMVTEWVVRQGK